MQAAQAVGSIPSISYVPEWLTPQEEAHLLHCIRTQPQLAWNQLSNRKLQNLGGVVHPKGLLQTALPSWIQPCLERCRQTGVFGDQPPNHVLINSYLPGQGILPHEDGPAYYPGVCIVSMGAPAVIHFTPKQSEEGSSPVAASGRTSLILQPRSLLVFKDLAYTHCLHGIDEVERDYIDPSLANLSMHTELQPGSQLPRQGERISLTVRKVEKVVKALMRLKPGS